MMPQCTNDIKKLLNALYIFFWMLIPALEIFPVLLSKNLFLESEELAKKKAWHADVAVGKALQISTPNPFDGTMTMTQASKSIHSIPSR